jgi:hypothetical protein
MRGLPGTALAHMNLLTASLLKGQSDSCIGKGRTWAQIADLRQGRATFGCAMARVTSVAGMYVCLSERSSQGHRRASRVSDLLQ